MKLQSLLLVSVMGIASITLEPAGNDWLKGSSALPVPGNAKGVIQLTVPDGTVSQAKFQRTRST